MKVNTLAKKLNLGEVTNTEKNCEVKGVYIGDLLSIVMANAEENNIWITIQTHLNTVAVADLLDLSCIIVVENMQIDEDTIEKANELDIPILKTDKTAYQLAIEIYKICGFE